jgi:hypothetical protein
MSQVPKTSKDAFESVKPMIHKHHAIIQTSLERLRLAMFEEIASDAHLDKWQIGRRLSEMEANGVIYRTSIKKPTSTGRNAYCYAMQGEGYPKWVKEENPPTKAPVKVKAEEPKRGIPVRAHIRQTKNYSTPPIQNKLF